MGPSIEHKSSSSILRDSESNDLERNGGSSLEDTSAVSVGMQIEREKDHDIKYRSCSWQKTVSARFIFRLFENSRHRHSNTLTGWAAWAGILAVTWIVAFVIAEVIPFFSDMLSLMSSLFDGWFGFIFWAMAYFELNPGKKRWESVSKIVQSIVNYFFILLGLYVLVAGTYVSIQSIIDSYHAQAVGGVFTCASNAL
ncbi:neutral amino acid [Moniliophthora roreri MCA 2997]|uniref:Neutral amino acid n=1 Tax=Moniliophthora roreri (strain MCA 2997) TaxID=1381753 RepID=V2WR31_MONRO|nr:neutral amino acid [Moniliophthora roreri MCA 2997]KAI3605839.1 neutral amino acid [Moniliophthora roreri]